MALVDLLNFLFTSKMVHHHIMKGRMEGGRSRLGSGVPAAREVDQDERGL